MLTDGGQFITEVWCRLGVPDPRSFHMTDNFAAIGQGMQQAIGAAHGASGRPSSYLQEMAVYDGRGE